MNKILIVEDDEAIREGLEYYLVQEKFTIIVARNGEETLNSVKNNPDISLILLDINLPDINGFDLFSNIKTIKNVPIIFLTANDLEVSVVRGLDMGADDYVTKPFKARELLSRIKMVLRRNNNFNDSIITIKDLKIDLNQAKVLKNGKEIFLTALEYKILLILVTNLNVALTREQILADIWDVSEDYVNDNTLTVYIKRLREKIEDDKDKPLIIETIRGIGYMVRRDD